MIKCMSLGIGNCINMIKKLVGVIAVSCVLSACSQPQKQQTAVKPVNVIFDTDMGPDYDDVGAITLLHYYAHAGKAHILATIASTKYPRVVPVLSVLNTYFKRPEIPVGVPKGQASELSDSQKWSDTLVAKYPHPLKSNADAPDAVKLYRQILAKQPDSSVTIITVGFFTNIAGLLQSKPDEYSPLSGEALIDKKVLKMVSMAGKFPSGQEFNIDEQAAASRYVFTHWKKPVIFSGYEIGAKIHTGLPLIKDSTIKNSPVQDAFRISIPKAKEDAAGRMSWDQTAVFVGIEGNKPYYRLQQGKIIIADDGSNTWVNNTTGNHYYLVAIHPAQQVQDRINKLMLYKPQN
jgi:inosine-uridine nucleoside N-ribohydrolase